MLRRPEKPDSCPERPMEKCSLCHNPLVNLRFSLYLFLIASVYLLFFFYFRVSNAVISYAKNAVVINALLVISIVRVTEFW